LVNTTPSEPRGLYLRTSEPPVRGRLVAFAAPSAAFPYADANLAYLRRVPLLKAVAAGPGDVVCQRGQELLINGAPRGAVAERDRAGRALPQWRGCRRLGAGELFAFADRVPNSFDSRYFGPISQRSVIGVFRPFLLFKDAF
jgi:conjugative transfer signal peptidase TraF